MAIGTAAAILGSAVIGGAVASRGASKAAKAQQQAAETASRTEQQMLERQLAETAPFRQMSLEQLNRLSALYGPEGAYARAPSVDEIQMDPGYGFRLSEGMKALERQQAARGGLLSGGAIKAGQRYAQDVASQEYGNAYNRLAQLANVGPAAAGVTNALGQNYATGAGNLMSQQGQVGANALLTGAAARQSAYGDIGQIWGKYLGG